MNNVGHFLCLVCCWAYGWKFRPNDKTDYVFKLKTVDERNN